MTSHSFLQNPDLQGAAVSSKIRKSHSQFCQHSLFGNLTQPGSHHNQEASATAVSPWTRPCLLHSHSLDEAKDILCLQASNIQPEGTAGCLGPLRTLSVDCEGSSQQLSPLSSCALYSQIIRGLQDISPAPTHVNIWSFHLTGKITLASGARILAKTRKHWV